MFYVIQEIMHQVALLPLAVMLVLMRTTDFGARRWTLAGVLAVSWIMDSLNVFFLADGLVASIVQYGKPVQIALVLGILVDDRRFLGALLGGLAVAVFASATQGYGVRELVVPLLGGFVITLYAWRMERDRIRSGLLVYFGLGAVVWVAWSLAANVPTWLTYQSTRLAGILLITAAMVQHARQPRLELV